MPMSGSGKILIVGLGPGDTEDVKGVQFVGRAGLLLKYQILSKVGLHKADISFTNAVRCRPPKNDPKLHQIEMCSAFLLQDIEKLQPAKIIALGQVAARSVLSLFGHLNSRAKFAVKDLTRRVFSCNTPKEPVPALVTYHPSAALRQQRVDYTKQIREHILWFLSPQEQKMFPKLEVLK